MQRICRSDNKKPHYKKPWYAPVTKLSTWVDNNILDLGRQMRVTYLPPLMVYMAAGISGLADRSSSATRPCGSKGIGGCDATMKLRLSSSRCESCPAKGEPARAGSQPCAGLGNKFCDA